MKQIYAKELTLSQVRGRVEQGLFAVPELQREFVWTALKACQLLDSVYHNYPIGTLLVWKTNRRNENQLRRTLHILPQFNPANDEIWFLIDGQQRLSVLWNFVSGTPAVVTNADGRPVDFGRVYFDLEAAEDSPLFVSRARVPAELVDRLVPVVDVLARNWKTKTRQFGRRKQQRILKCRERLLAYRVMFVFCETEDRHEVRETFVRVNSLGMKIGAADRAFARASRLKMRNLVQELEGQLKNGFDQVRRETVLQTMALALGSRDLGERAIQNMVARVESDQTESEEFTRQWRRLSEAFKVASDYLVDNLKVASFDFLPSEPMLSILALYFFHKGKGRPPKAAQRKLRQWFWATAVGARYTGRGYRINLTADAAFAERLAKNPNAKLPSIGRLPVDTLRRVDYSRPGPVSNAVFSLLRDAGPRYLEDGERIPLGEISSRSNRNDKHHVFPKALLARHGIGTDRANSILNICYLVARENQVIGSRPPRKYLDDLPQSIGVRNRVLRSHLLPTGPESGLWMRSVRSGFRRFMEEREALLRKALSAAAGMPLFEGRGKGV